MPRCPQCHYLTQTPGACAVCQSDVPVHRVTDAEVAGALALARQAMRGAPTTPSPRRGAPGPQDTRHARQPYPCETPGCARMRVVSPKTVGRLHSLKHPVLCELCSAQRTRQYQRAYQRERAQRLREERA